MISFTKTDYSKILNNKYYESLENNDIITSGNNLFSYNITILLLGLCKGLGEKGELKWGYWQKFMKS